MKRLFRSCIIGCLISVATVHAGDSYQPCWESLKTHRVPQWYADAKLGIYFHWSAYSVPAFYSEWYSHDMYQVGTAQYQYHLKTFGPLDQFGYKDFIPKFTAEKFSADEWANLFAQAGAKFAGPVAEHCDGFSLWDSKVNPWNAARMGPHRDLVGELSRAILKQNLKFVTTFHHQWLWGWYSSTEKKADVNDPAYSEFYGTPLPASAFDFENPQPGPSKEFSEKWKQKVVEVIDQYHPDLIYFDSRTMIIPEATHQEMLAHYYNQASLRKQEVVMTYKNEDFAVGTGVIDLEQGRMANIMDYIWQNDDTLDWKSWAYLQNPNYKSATRIIHELVDIVSKNGILLLDIGPRPDGTIPDAIQDRLRAIGAWLETNGEAIYGSRPWRVFGEGPTKVEEGHFSESKIGEFTPQDIRFTTKGNDLYAIALGWPSDGRLLIRALSEEGPKVSSVHLFGHKGDIKWVLKLEGLEIALPAEKPCEAAFVIKIKAAK